MDKQDLESIEIIRRMYDKYGEESDIELIVDFIKDRGRTDVLEVIQAMRGLTN